MPVKPLLEPAEIPTEVLFDLEAIRKYNPQRGAMEQLTAITMLDLDAHLICGYKDTSKDDFWVPGHMPDYPLMPGVIMCEAAAQLTSFYAQEAKLLKKDFVGFGGMDQVRFRGSVMPGQRLTMVGKTERHSSRTMNFHVQGFVETQMVFHGDFLGIPLNRT